MQMHIRTCDETFFDYTSLNGFDFLLREKNKEHRHVDTGKDEGGHVGPDLTGIGAIRSGHDLLEAIVFPSASFVPGHEVYNVDTEKERLSGVIRSQSKEAVVLVTGPKAEVRIPRSAIKSLTPSKVSLMPEGFDEQMTKSELTDLLAFLQAEKTRPQAVTANAR